MSLVHGWLPDFDTALLSVGEQSGRLDQSFRLLASYYDSRAKLIRDTLAGLMVTAATLHVFLLVMPLGFLIEFAQGVMNGDLKQMLPFIIEKIAVYGILWGSIFLSIFASQGNRGEGWRSAVESVLGCVPVLRTARKYLSLGRLAAALEALNSAGVSVTYGWELASAASTSPRLRRIVSDWAPQVEAGSTPGELVSQDGYFPEMFSNLYFTGEQSGRLDDALMRLRAYYEEEGFRLLRVFTRIMNGVIYGSVAVMVGYYVINFWVHYYGTLLNNI
jgi:type II secretory pathway component PulF